MIQFICDYCKKRIETMEDTINVSLSFPKTEVQRPGRGQLHVACATVIAAQLHIHMPTLLPKSLAGRIEATNQLLDSIKEERD